jgi:hypothetical protein
MTLQHSFAENRFPGGACLLSFAGCGTGVPPASVEKAGWKPALQRHGITMIVVSLLTRAPDEAHLAKCFPAQKPAPEKTIS